MEVAAALIMGLPALVNEGLSWKDVRLRTKHATPVRLPALPESRYGVVRNALGRAEPRGKRRRDPGGRLYVRWTL